MGQARDRKEQEVSLFDGKVDVVTETGRGTGRHVARQFTAERAKDVGCGPNEAADAETVGAALLLASNGAEASQQ